jgi:hypothetical protein
MKSIAERITENRIVELRKIRVNAGDSFNALAEGSEMQGNEVLPSNLTLIVGTLAPASSSSLGRDHYMQTYHVACPIAVSDDSTDSSQLAGQRLVAEVMKQMQEDYQCGALALNTYFRSARPDEMLPQIDGQYVTFDVLFWTLKDDPFNQ